MALLRMLEYEMEAWKPEKSVAIWVGLSTRFPL
jgi:hypothetical protein